MFSSIVERDRLIDSEHPKKRTKVKHGSLLLDILSGRLDALVCSLIMEYAVESWLERVFAEQTRFWYVWDKLLPYQKEGVEAIYNHRGRYLLADEMGVGKTLQAIAACTLYSECWPVLVVCLSSLRYNWSTELQKWLHMEPSRICIFKSGKAVLNHEIQSSIRFYIISYDLLAKPEILEKIKTFKFQVLVSDESHSIRNAKSKRSLSVSQLCLLIPYVIFLSGTPGHCPHDLYSLLKCIQPHLLPDFWVVPKMRPSRKMFRANSQRLQTTYAARWCDPDDGPIYGSKRQWLLKGFSRKKEFFSIVSHCFMIRRPKSQVLKDLPEKIRQKIVFEVEEKERIKIQNQFETMKHCREQNASRYRVIMMELYNDLIRIKTPFLKKYLKEVMDEEMPYDDESILIFGHHKACLDLIEQVVKESKFSKQYIKIDGSTPQSKRQDYVNEFQKENSNVRIAILSLTAAGTGLNFYRATKVIMCETWFEPAILTQAECRAHRMGVKSNVLVRYLIASSTIDEWIWGILQKKENNQGYLLEGKSTPFQINDYRFVEAVESNA